MKIVRYHLFTVSGKQMFNRGYRGIGPVTAVSTDMALDTPFNLKRLARSEKMVGEKCEWRKAK